MNVKYHKLLLQQLPPSPNKNTGWPWNEESYIPDKMHVDMINLPKISIITPSFNKSEYIEATIRSVLLQNYPNLEYIVIDGNSTDDSFAKIVKYSKWIDYYASRPDFGQYYAIKEGFDISTGEIMLWINSDDMLIKNSLWILASIFTKYRDTVHWVSGIPVYFDQYGNMNRFFRLPDFSKNMIKRGCYDGRAIGWIMQECTAWTRKLWIKSGATLDLSLDYAADFELWTRFAKYEPLFFLSALIGGNRQVSGQKTENIEIYNSEIDQVIRRSNTSFLLNYILRKKPFRSFTRMYFFSRSPSKHIYYNARKCNWEIVSL